MKSLKKISCLLLSGVLLAGGVGLQKASAASNHSDTGFSFSLGTWSRNSYTGARQKMNSTSAYAKLNNSKYNRLVTFWIERSDGNSVGSKTIVLKPGQSKYIINYAYEKYGKCSVRLGADTNSNESDTTTANGLWSPDSI